MTDFLQRKPTGEEGDQVSASRTEEAASSGGLRSLGYQQAVQALTPSSSGAARLESYVTNPSGGAALDGAVQAKMEQGFGQPVQGRSVHTGGQAAEACQALGARAFTHGNHMFFGQGEYNPGSSSGQGLIAHELTHTFQQQGGVQTKLRVGGAHDSAEAEADSVAGQVMSRISGGCRSSWFRR